MYSQGCAERRLILNRVEGTNNIKTFYEFLQVTTSTWI